MREGLVRSLFSIIFLFIFSVKMVISIAPLITIHLDTKIMNSVIMQLEIETNSSKGSDQAKDSLNKGEWLSAYYKFNFEESHALTDKTSHIQLADMLIDIFYPRIPSPPPNC